jgi:hypothetical protein
MPKRPRFPRRIALLLVLALLAVACQEGGGGTTPPTPGFVPVIERFDARDDVLYREGASTELSWRVSGGPSNLLLVSQGGATVDVTGRDRFVVTPPASALAVTYRLIATNARGRAEAEVTVRSPTPTVLRGRLALDNLIDAAAEGEAVGAASHEAEAFRADLAALATLLPERLAEAGVVAPAALLRSQQVARVLYRAVAPESVYAAESIVVVDADGIVHDVGRVGADGSWRVVVPRYGVYVLLRARADAAGDLVCFQPLEVEVRGAAGRAASVQPLLIRSSPDFDVTVGRFALNELTGHLAVVSTQIAPELLLPPDLAPFFRISDQVMRCQHPDPAKVGVAAGFAFEAPIPGAGRDDAAGINLPGTFDFGTLWLTNADDTAADLTLASTNVDDGGQSAADLRFRAGDPEAVLPIVHDTCLLNFDKCITRFEEGGLLLPFVVPEELAADLQSASDGVRIASTSSVRTAIVTGRATLASGAAAAGITLTFQEMTTGSIGLTRTDASGNYSVSVALPATGAGQYFLTANVKVGRTLVPGKIGCGNNCTFSAVRTYRGLDDQSRSTNIVF